jgi:hypothetical protein
MDKRIKNYYFAPVFDPIQGWIPGFFALSFPCRIGLGSTPLEIPIFGFADGTT